MGRRRRRVVRIPRRRLPKFFDCPKCGLARVIRIVIKEVGTNAKVECGKCGEKIRKYLREKPVAFNCPNCGDNIATISTESEEKAKILCGRCGTTDFHKITGEKTTFNCSCHALTQAKITINPAKKLAAVHCGNCKLADYFEARPIDKPIDIYSVFLDRYYGVHKPRPPKKKREESYLDILKREVGPKVYKPPKREAVVTVDGQQKEMFERLDEEEKKKRKLRDEG